MAEVDHFIETYCTCETNDRPAHVADQHATDILSTTLQPLFKKQASLHPTLAAKRSQSRYGSKHIDIHEDQQWKNACHVQLLSWLLSSVSVSSSSRSAPCGRGQTSQFACRHSNYRTIYTC